jgi:hypothetical protein
MAKSKGATMGEYLATAEEWKAYRWCLRNNIYIAPKAVTEVRWTITVTNKGKTNQDPENYPKVVIWEKVFNYYKHYYNKYEQKI